MKPVFILSAVFLFSLSLHGQKNDSLAIERAIDSLIDAGSQFLTRISGQDLCW